MNGAMQLPVGVQPPSSTTLEAYAEDCRACGFRVVQGEGRSLWISHGRAAMVRFPTFSLAPVLPGELRNALGRGRAALVSYLEPAEPGAGDAFLYVRSRPYERAQLSSGTRKSLRHALANLRMAPVDWKSLAEAGLPAFADTRRRAGLSDGNERTFRLNVEIYEKTRGHAALGAWSGDELVAYVVVLHCDDFAELVMWCSRDDSLSLCPNNALYHHVFERYLGELGCGAVSAGISSIQTGRAWEGLHSFKERVGFDAVAVRRTLILHPLIRPLVNRFSFAGLRGLTRIAPGNPFLRKGLGAMARLLGEEPVARRARNEQREAT
jgi:hypothetical protein